MRKIILIAAMALTSAAAQAGEIRNLSVAAAPSVAPASSQTKQLQAQNDALVAPAAKPADTPPTTASTAPSTSTPSTARPERRYDDQGYYDDAGYHPFPRRYSSAEPSQGDPGRPHHRARWNARGIIAELHRYGVYW